MFPQTSLPSGLDSIFLNYVEAPKPLYAIIHHCRSTWRIKIKPTSLSCNTLTSAEST
ncbi:hypothetical protein HanPI659440_Chr10g0383641 [Helianthus annuus]|nr:hypothetical protein HanPI659440_Chr10g0383641 [Helianthus annuus]